MSSNNISKVNVGQANIGKARNNLAILGENYKNLKVPQDVQTALTKQVLLSGIDIKELNEWLSNLVYAPEQGMALDPKLTNLQIIENLMMYSAYGSLVQIFVIQAILDYSERVTSTSMPENTNDPINPRHWWAIANEIKGKLSDKVKT